LYGKLRNKTAWYSYKAGQDTLGTFLSAAPRLRKGEDAAGVSAQVLPGCVVGLGTPVT